MPSAIALRHVFPVQTKRIFIRAYTSPMRSGALSRSADAGIAPGRMTRGRGPVQSITVDGLDGDRVPASSTRNLPRVIASPHCCKISVADIAGGTPGRFALVDVMGSPYA